MREVEIVTVIEYIEVIATLAECTVNYRGAKDPVEDMKPTVVRSWQRNRRIRGDNGREPALSLPEYEERLVEAFQRQALPFLDQIPDSHLNWLSVAQHYQLPTRLLDWTRNPLIALYFAANNRGVYTPPQGWEDVFVFVWEVSDTLDSHRHMLPLDRVAGFRPMGDGLIADERASAGRGVLLFNPPILSSRTASQEGLFSFEPRISEISFPEVAETAGLSLTRIRVRGGARLGILKHLNRLGVETGKLFPDLPGLCAHQKWVAEWLW
ncbi:MAG TPA: FRG domain-containing protein [Azospirillaceae bacterium]|nr:FRG domain-containing protein [Azospirillaceae bacterium]